MRTMFKRAAVAIPAASVLGFGAIGVIGDSPAAKADPGMISTPAHAVPDPTGEHDSNESSEDKVNDNDTDSNFDDKDTEYNKDEASDTQCAGSSGEDKAAVPLVPDLATINVC